MQACFEEESLTVQTTEISRAILTACSFRQVNEE